MYLITIQDNLTLSAHPYLPLDSDQAHMVAKELSRDYSGACVTLRHLFSATTVATYRNGFKTGKRANDGALARFE